MMNMDNGAKGMDGSWSSQGNEQNGVLAYLANLGVDDADLANIAGLLEWTNDPGPAQPLHKADAVLDLKREELIRLLEGEDLLKTGIPIEPAPDTVYPLDQPVRGASECIKLCILEEQLVLKEAYRSFFTSAPSFEVLGLYSETSDASLRGILHQQKPNVILLGLKSAQQPIGSKLDIIKELCPQAGLVVLFAFYDSQGMKALREFSNSASAGYAYLLKHNIDTAIQLAQVVHAVAQGRIIVDPQIMEELVEDDYIDSKVLTALSPKELQVLSWVARGYANDAIANVLSRDRKAVERQVSSIYTKLQLGDGKRDSRVGAALMYLTATGMLPRG